MALGTLWMSCDGIWRGCGRSDGGVGVAVPAEPMPIFENRIAQFAAQLNDVKQEAVAVVGHGNAFQEIIGFMLNNCELHQYR